MNPRCERLLAETEENPHAIRCALHRRIDLDLQLARICALREDRSCALDHIGAWASRKSYRTQHVRRDPLLQSLRDEPEFQRHLARVDARGAALRKRLAMIGDEIT